MLPPGPNYTCFLWSSVAFLSSMMCILQVNNLRVNIRLKRLIITKIVITMYHVPWLPCTVWGGWAIPDDDHPLTMWLGYELWGCHKGAWTTNNCLKLNLSCTQQKILPCWLIGLVMFGYSEIKSATIVGATVEVKNMYEPLNAASITFEY